MTSLAKHNKNLFNISPKPSSFVTWNKPKWQGIEGATSTEKWTNYLSQHEAPAANVGRRARFFTYQRYINP